jgi:BMFP domain-containing protein YqiC
MDPIRNLLDYLQNNFADKLPKEALATVENAARELFSRFELVPKHEFEAQLQILASLEQQVAALEARLAELEQAS